MDDENDDDEDVEQQSEKSWTYHTHMVPERPRPSRGSGTASSGAARKSGTNAPPPTYDGSKEPGIFDDYKIKAKLWLKTSDLDDMDEEAEALIEDPVADE